MSPAFTVDRVVKPIPTVSVCLSNNYWTHLNEASMDLLQEPIWSGREHRNVFVKKIISALKLKVDSLHGHPHSVCYIPYMAGEIMQDRQSSTDTFQAYRMLIINC